MDLATSIQLSNLTINANNYKQTFLNTVVSPTLVKSHSPVVATTNIIANSPPINFCNNLHPSYIDPSPLIKINYNYPKCIVDPQVYKYPACLPRVQITDKGKIPSRAIAWSRFRPVKVLYDGHVVGLTAEDLNLPLPNDIAYTPEAGTLLINRTVVARSVLDGYYYKGKVISQVGQFEYIDLLFCFILKS